MNEPAKKSAREKSVEKDVRHHRSRGRDDATIAIMIGAKLSEVKAVK